VCPFVRFTGDYIRHMSNFCRHESNSALLEQDQIGNADNAQA
jgi:hypothetical protein